VSEYVCVVCGGTSHDSAVPFISETACTIFYVRLPYFSALEKLNFTVKT